jgi:hypothetical protein
MTKTLTDSPLPTELLDYGVLDIFKHHLMVLPSFAFYGFVGFLYHASNIMWARLQRKIILSLKAPPASSLNSGHPNSDSKSEPKTNNDNQYEDSRGFLYYLGIGLLGFMYLTMYIDYVVVKYDAVLTPPLLVQDIVIGLCPLAIPYEFYKEYPSAAKWLLVCWAEIWLRHTYIWMISMLIDPLLHILSS